MDEIGSLEVRSEVATSDLEWRRIREHESPCVGVFSGAIMSQTLAQCANGLDLFGFT